MMRTWITLCEGKSPLHTEVEAAGMQLFGWVPNGSEAKHFYGTSDVAELIEIIERDINQLFKTGYATLHRILIVEPETVDQFQEGMSLGPKRQDQPASWTTDWTEIEPSAIYGGASDSSTTSIMVLLEARIPLTAVDMAATIAQNIELYWEKEIALLRGKNIELISIHEVRKHGEYVRPLRNDLWRSTMRS